MKAVPLKPNLGPAGAQGSTDRMLLEALVREVRELRAEVRAMNRARAAFDAGRAKAIGQMRRRAEQHERLVLHWAAFDADRGHSPRGRAGRVTRQLRGLLSESQVQRILRKLSSSRDSAVSNDSRHTLGEKHA